MEKILAVVKTIGATCGGVETALISCGDNENGIYGVLAIVVNVLTAAVGVAAVIGIVIAGVQYMTSSGDPATMTKAKNRIVQVVIGLVAWGLMWAFLEWLLPGGVLNGN